MDEDDGLNGEIGMGGEHEIWVAERHVDELGPGAASLMLSHIELRRRSLDSYEAAVLGRIEKMRGREYRYEVVCRKWMGKGGYKGKVHYDITVHGIALNDNKRKIGYDIIGMTPWMSYQTPESASARLKELLKICGGKVLFEKMTKSDMKKFDEVAHIEYPVKYGKLLHCVGCKNYIEKEERCKEKEKLRDFDPIHRTARESTILELCPYRK